VAKLTDDAALIALYEAEHAALTRFARLVSFDPVLADDLVQDAFLRLGLRRNWPARVDDPPAYLRRIVANLAKDHKRAERRRRSREERVTEWDRAVAGAVDFEAGTDPGVVALRTVLAGLSPQQRAVLVLRYFEDRSVEETAAVLGISSGSVKTHSHRGLQRLRAVLEGAKT
jgi:RNA polymerase sigma factor (sigma-70 family)